VNTDDRLQTDRPSPEATLALTRELVARSRARLRELDRRLAKASDAEASPPDGGDAPA